MLYAIAMGQTIMSITMIDKPSVINLVQQAQFQIILNEKRHAYNLQIMGPDNFQTTPEDVHRDVLLAQLDIILHRESKKVPP